MTFQGCVVECAGNRELVENFDRLAGTHLSEFGLRAPIDRMIDKATGRDRDAMQKFIAFVYEAVWIRLPREETDEQGSDNRAE